MRLVFFLVFAIALAQLLKLTQFGSASSALTIKAIRR